VINI